MRTVQDYLRVKEVAALMAVSMQTVYKLVKNGELKSSRVGNRGIRIPREEVEAFMNGQRRDV